MNEFNIVPSCYIADNAASAQAASRLLVNWSNEIRQLQQEDVESTESLTSSASPQISSQSDNAAQQDLEDDLPDQFPPDDEVRNQVQLAFDIPAENYGCYCHHLELIIHHSLFPLQDELEKLREFAKDLRRNSSFARLFSQDGNVPYLPLDITTRWSSTFFLLDAFIGNIQYPGFMDKAGQSYILHTYYSI